MNLPSTSLLHLSVQLQRNTNGKLSIEGKKDQKKGAGEMRGQKKWKGEGKKPAKHEDCNLHPTRCWGNSNRIMVFILKMDDHVACVELGCYCEHVFTPTDHLKTSQHVLGSPGLHIASWDSSMSEFWIWWALRVKSTESGNWCPDCRSSFPSPPWKSSTSSCPASPTRMWWGSS